jgi:hypothetical protein
MVVLKTTGPARSTVVVVGIDGGVQFFRLCVVPGALLYRSGGWSRCGRPLSCC